MKTPSRLLTTTAVVLFLAATPAEAARIGVASSVVNTVNGSTSGRLRSGSSVTQGETVSTGAQSATQLLFRDRTSITLGANARLTLNTAVYNPERRTGQVVAKAAKGAFRFVSGLTGRKKHRVETPRATIGIRGSILEGYIDEATGVEVIVLIQGELVVCTQGANCVTVTSPGNHVVINASGTITGPTAWRGPLMNLNAGVDFVQFAISEIVETGDDPLPRTQDANDAEDGRSSGTRLPPAVDVETCFGPPAYCP